jgi:hypothetical protein
MVRPSSSRWDFLRCTVGGSGRAEVHYPCEFPHEYAPGAESRVELLDFPQEIVGGLGDVDERNIGDGRDAVDRLLPDRRVDPQNNQPWAEHSSGHPFRSIPGLDDRVEVGDGQGLGTLGVADRTGRGPANRQ